MKHITLLISLLCIVFGTQAQITPDPELRTGVLSSGTRYYIRHNAKPQGQADFYLISDVGAIQESDDQQGLAHFLEHMAFNGTKNFPDKAIIEYLEKVGVKFGANLNASTSWDVTTYMMKDVPVARKGTIDSALLILHDWAHFITPEQEEIDKERGVIKEELRTRDNADWRGTIELIKALGRGTKYTQRNLIGYLEDLETFQPQSLISFYEEWYRPEYQAVIIVGDVDANDVEQRIISLMSDIAPTPDGAPQKQEIIVPDNQEPIVSIYTDPEMQYTCASIFIKRRATPKHLNNRFERRRFDILMSLMSQMQNERFSDIEMQPNAPFLGAYMYSGDVGVIPSMETTSFSVYSADNELPKALATTLTEIERSRQHGYTQGEFLRAQQSLLSSTKSRYTNRNDRTNNSFVRGYIRNFRFGAAIPSGEQEWHIDSTILSRATLSDVNVLTNLLSHNNNVVVVNAPEKEGVTNPTSEDILRLIDSVRNSVILPFVDSAEHKPLITDIESLKGSAVVEQRSETRADATVWRLENGIEVVVKPTTLKADEVVLRAYTDGGASILSDEEYYTGLYLPTIMGYSGLAELSATELGKQLSGKIAGLSLWVSDYSNGLSGSSSVEDVETMLQLLYLNFTAPRFSRDDFEIFREQMRASVKNSESDPDYIASKKLREVAYNNSARRRVVSMGMIDSMSFETLQPLHNKLFGNGTDLRFVIVGSVDTVTLKPLVERYIGSLPTPQRKALGFVDDGVRPVTGDVKESFEHLMQQPKVAVNILYSGDVEYTLRNRVVASFFNMALDNQYLKSVREERGGTYGVGARLSLHRAPKAHYTLNISFDTNMEQSAELIPLIEQEIVSIATHGVESEQIAKSREFLLKDFRNQLEHNSGVAGYISALYSGGLDYFGEYESAVSSIRSEDIKALAQRIIVDGNRVEVVLNPLE